MPTKKSPANSGTTANSVSSLDAIRHSLAHLLAAAVLKEFPDAKLGIGPTIDTGFYYDFELPRSLAPADLKTFEKTMRSLINKKLPFTGEEVSADEARKRFASQPFKLDLINEFAKDGKQLTIYHTGGTGARDGSALNDAIFSDLCRGGHVENTSEIPAGAFKLDKIAGAYWRGDEKNPQLQRIYGLAFASETELDAYLKMREEAEKRDHKKLGQQLDLFTFSDLVGPGLPLWTPRGTLIRNLLDDFVWELRRARGYMKVEIPHITKKDLYERSGHWDKFKDELFRIKTREGHEFAMKPMNCPHHTQIYARKQWSYRELPQRYANSTMCYRDEQTGELSGLSRVRAFTQDDAHVFCRMLQTKEEFLKVWDIVPEFYGAFGFEMRVRLSLHDPEHPEKYLGDKARWVEAEGILREIVMEKATSEGAVWFEGIGEAAFYGPKLDFMAKDAIGREWQVATIQLDFNQPERFDLFCINEGGEHERIVMIHAAIMGSIERFLSVLIEHVAGAFPVWLSPVQVVVLPVSDKFDDYAQGVVEKLLASDIRAEVSVATESLGKRIREAEMMKIPYVLVVGEKEEAAGTVAVRARGRDGKPSGDEGTMPVAEFAARIAGEIKKKTA
jgi:threonyl-tRNA synthetase